MKYQRKPEIVEAWQFNGTLDGAPEWVNAIARTICDGTLILRDHSNGWVFVPNGDWVTGFIFTQSGSKDIVVVSDTYDNTNFEHMFQPVPEGEE